MYQWKLSELYILISLSLTIDMKLTLCNRKIIRNENAAVLSLNFLQFFASFLYIEYSIMKTFHKWLKYFTQCKSDWYDFASFLHKMWDLIPRKRDKRNKTSHNYQSQCIKYASVNQIHSMMPTIFCDSDLSLQFHNW